MKKLYDENLMPRNTTLADARQLFMAGKVGMWIDINGFFGAMKKVAPQMYDKAGAAPMPFPNNRTLYNACTVGISKDCKYKDAAWEYIKFITQPKWQKRVVEICKAIPGRTGMIDEKFLSQNPWFKAYADGLNEHAITSVPPGFEAQGEEYKKVVIDYVSEMLNKNLPVEESMKRLQAELERRFLH